MPIDIYRPTLVAFWHEHDSVPPALRIEYRANFSRWFGPAFTALWHAARPS